MAAQQIVHKHKLRTDEGLFSIETCRDGALLFLGNIKVGTFNSDVEAKICATEMLEDRGCSADFIEFASEFSNWEFQMFQSQTIR